MLTLIDPRVGANGIQSRFARPAANSSEDYIGVQQPSSASKQERKHWKRLQGELGAIRRSESEPC
jgi:hypothetical protein